MCHSVQNVFFHGISECLIGVRIRFDQIKQQNKLTHCLRLSENEYVLFL